MSELSLIESSIPKFSLDELLELERLFKELGEKSLDQNFCQEIALGFSSSSNGGRKTPILWEQVQQWFRNKLKESQDAMKQLVDLSDTSSLRNGLIGPPSLAGNQDINISELVFEARSSKDHAWHDVASFLNYRVLSTGELEVRIRYAGFGKEQDEWVNVKAGVRERSIPLEPSECHLVKEGHLVLCFRVRDDYALYCDACVVKIQRMLHDSTECRCSFIVRYVYDSSEEAVSMDRICRRPSQDESEAFLDPTLNPVLDPTLNPFLLNPIESLWG